MTRLKELLGGIPERILVGVFQGNLEKFLKDFFKGTLGGLKNIIGSV